MGRIEARILDRAFQFEWGSLAGQAGGAVLAREADTVVLVTACAANEEREGIDFFPLTVDYRERLSAVGRFPGGYRKREGAASIHEILTSRLIDRSIRPLFPDRFRAETQVLATVLACDPDGDPATLGILGAAAALELSDIPFDGPVAAVRVGRGPEGAPIAYPRRGEAVAGALDLVATVGRQGLVMVEGGAAELAEEEILEALAFAERQAAPLLEAIGRLRGEGRPKRPVPEERTDPEMAAAVREACGDAVAEAARTPAKEIRRDRLAAARERMREKLAARFEGRERERDALFEALVAESFRERILSTATRADGRGPADVRAIRCEISWLPRVHGSALFTRGETQAAAVCTLGTGADEQEVEGLAGKIREAFQLYYRFPPYSVGEVRPLRAPGRREIGHGALALRALEPILPERERFPYTIKLESEITSSNGSSSMATVCGGCLALMDAGVPILRPVAGIAMGLVRDAERTAILSDILGDEDHLGEMDFKVAGTEQGITALQLDNKVGALPSALLAEALAQARDGRLAILGEMAKTISRPKPDLSPLAPRIEQLRIGPHRIRELIGPGGRTIQAVQVDTETKIDVSDDGSVRIYAQSVASLDAAVRRIHDLTGEPVAGRFYRGSVTGVREFGLFVRLFEGIEGLVHASELAEGRPVEPGQVAAVGDEIVVQVLGVEQGKIKLSRKRAAGVSESEIEAPPR